MRTVLISSDETTAVMMLKQLEGSIVEVVGHRVDHQILHDFRARTATTYRRGDEEWQRYLDSNKIRLVIVALATNEISPTVNFYIRSAHRVPIIVGDWCRIDSILQLLMASLAANKNVA